MDLSTLLRTVDFSAYKHRKQTRKDIDRTPYINHPIGVATILAYEAHVDDIITLQAALLHDTVEDVGVTFDELEQKFGKDVANIVKEVTDDKCLSKTERKRQQIIHASTCSYRAKLVKLADKISNLRDLISNPPSFWSLSRIQGYFVWTYFVWNALKGNVFKDKNDIRCGTNLHLDTILGELFKSTFTFNGCQYPCLPNGDLNTLLEEYYKLVDVHERQQYTC